MPPTFSKPNFRRVSFKFNEGSSIVVGGEGETGMKLAGLAVECLTRTGRRPACVLLGHPNKKTVQKEMKKIKKFYPRKKIVPIHSTSNDVGMGKSLKNAVRKKGKWATSITQGIGYFKEVTKKDFLSIYIHFSDTGGSGGVMGDDALRAMVATDKFEYVLNCIPQATKDSDLSQENEGEILSNATRCSDKVRTIYMQNFNKAHSKDVANVSAVCAIAVGTFGGETENYEISDWWTLLPSLVKLNCETEGNVLEGIWPKIPNYHRTINSASIAVKKMRYRPQDYLVLIGDINPSLLTTIWKDVASEIGLPKKRKVCPLSIADEKNNVVAAKFSRFCFVPLGTPNFDKSHEIDEVK